MAKVKSMKQYREKQEINKKSTDEKEISNLLDISNISYILLIAIFLFSFYIRGITPIDNVFRNGIVGFAMDDSVFQMKLVENTIHFFPHRIFYDAFTQYPYGGSLFWGPLFDQMIAFFALAAGILTNAGMPSQITIDTIGAFFPAVLGALIVFPVYFIGKELIDNKAGLIGAFLIAILPGQFLSRSVLGFTDHHIAEVFFVTLMMMFFIMAIKRSENITLDHWLNKDWNALKKPLIYTLLAGISFGAYLLVWTNGVFFAVVFGIFIIIQYIIDHFRGRSTEYLGIVGIIAYIVAMIMVIPYFDISNGFDSGRYSFLHLAVTGGAAAVFASLSLISREMNKRTYGGIHYLLFLSGTLVIVLIAIKILLPGLYDGSVGQIGFLFEGRTGGGLTIAEGSPISYESAVGNFGYNYILSYIGIILLCYYAIKRSNAEYTLLVIWSVFVLAIMLAQNRFAYYYAVNVAILSGVLGSRLLDLAGWKQFNSNDILECLKKIRVQHVLSFIIVIAVTGFLPSGASPFQTTMEQAKWGAVSSGFYEWHDALTWMKDNTPQPDLPYYSIYEKPLPGQKYNYSKNDYGVMSWWDYGHIITYWAHRIPNANPFQAGIGGGDSHAPGASTFLIAPTEAQANKVLDDLGINGNPGARYVVSNAYMAYSIQPVFAEWDNTNNGYYEQVQTSQGYQVWPSLKYYDTMESKLHIFDTNGLQNYRLVHESTPNPYTSGGNEEKAYKSIYNTLKRTNVIPAEDSGYAKIFEHVKGAKITGNAPPNSIVTITNTIRTNIGRTIQYKQEASSDGTYELIVPYSTLGPVSGETQFDTKPTGAYTVTAGKISKQVEIREMDVLEGKTVTLDLLGE
ncbi:MAG: oligosaccharyl transferase, archaeosortase A system-associated [Candidatus Methanoperedens sp.]|nr:oligosaccharyl transferase, archaeosortase A system-associated [Candidatus Methanoperedens sp.]